MEMTLARRRGFAKTALIWLLFWLSAGGFFLCKAAPKRAPVVDAASRPVLAFSAPAAPPHTKNIEDVKAGDRVWAYDPQAGKWEPKQVLKPLTHEYEGDLVTVTVAGHTVQATGNHPFWVEAGQNLSRRPRATDVPLAEQTRPSRGQWVAARNLEAGDLVVLRTGGLSPIEVVTVRQTRQTVYNLRVADLHTYAVGEVGIAVHNKSAPIFRAVGPDELAGIRGSGNDTPSPGGLESKYFYPTPQQAASYASQPFNAPGGPYTLTSTQAPPSVLSAADTVNVATEGDVITIPNEYLPGLPPPTVYDTMPLPHP